MRYFKNSFLAVLSAIALFSLSAPAAAEEVCQVAQNHPRLPGLTFTFTGQCVDGLVSGDGVIQWSMNGNPTTRETGRCRAGLRVGPGTTEFANGDRSEGEFVDGVQSGKGKYFWLTGEHYEGDFLNGMRSGTWHPDGLNGDRYEGQFAKDDQTGDGEVVKSDGSRVQGATVAVTRAIVAAEHPRVKASCPNAFEISRKMFFPMQASLKGITHGQVSVEFEINGETSSNFVVTSSSDPAFNNTALQAATSLRCKSSTPVHIVLPLVFELLE